MNLWLNVVAVFHTAFQRRLDWNVAQRQAEAKQ